MAFALRSLFLLCGISGLLTGVGSFPINILTDVSCPEGWTQLDCDCYIFQAEARSFADAEAICNILGGNVVSIHNDLENAIVQQLIIAGGNTAAFIGLHNALAAGDFIWTDGTVEDFRNFVPMNPISGNCVILVTVGGLWVSVPCTGPGPYVCIKEAHHFLH
ncbi:galactose-specific lectin nattectin-like isoform X2 [Festucalex cinctus]